MVEPRRKCIVTGRVLETSALVRFVVGPDTGLVADVDGKLPGRGVWVSASRSHLETAIDKRLFHRALRRQITVAPELAAMVENRLLRRCLDILGLARRAGQLVSGFEKVRAAVKAGRIGVLIQADDGAADGRQKLARLFRAGTVIDAFSVEELSLALGHENVVHAALNRGRLADRFVQESMRLSGFRVTDRIAAELSVEQA